MISESLRFSLRAAFRDPVLTLSSVVLLTLGISTFAAGASVVKSVILDPTPFSQAPDLVRLWGSPVRNRLRQGLSGTEVKTLAELPGVVAAGYFGGHTSSLELPGGTQSQVISASVSAGLLEALAVKPVAGRTFSAEEDRKEAIPVCLIREDTWQRLFAGQTFISGKNLKVDGIERVILGVLPANFSFPQPKVEIWLPVRTGPWEPMLEQDVGASFGLVVRLKPDMVSKTLEAQAIAAMNALNAERGADDHRQVWAELLDEVYLNPIRQPMRVLTIAVGLVLLSTVLNLSVLQLARSAKADRESAIRFALGETREGIMLRAMMDGIFPCGVAVVLSSVVAGEILRLIQQTPALGQIPLKVDVWSILSGMVVGLVAIPLASITRLRSWRAPMEILRGGAAVNLAPWRWISVAQLAISFASLAGALYFVGAWGSLSRVDPGFDPKDLQVLEVRLPVERFPLELSSSSTWGNNQRIIQRIQDEVRQFGQLPATAVGMVHPITPGWTTKYRVPGLPPDPELKQIRLRVVGERYFETAHIGLVAGRTFSAEDDQQSMPVAIINEAAAKRFFPGGEAIGKTINAWYDDRHIVGVVADTHFLGIELDKQPAVYTPIQQSPAGFVFLTIRSQLAPAVLRQKVVESVARVESGLVVSEAQSVEDLVYGPLNVARFGSSLAVAVASTVVALAIVGLYGLMSASTLAWRREMALRLCLGAERKQILWLVLRRAGRVAGVGLVVGMITVSLGQWLFSDLLTIRVEWEEVAMSGAICLVCCFIASLGPALQALRFEPASLLRSE